MAAATAAAAAATTAAAVVRAVPVAKGVKVAAAGAKGVAAW